MQATGKFRTTQGSYTRFTHTILFAEDLDMAAKTLYIMIAYYTTLKDFTLYKSYLQHKSGLGQCAFNRLWKQLKDQGYLRQRKYKNEKGTFCYEYELVEQPHETNSVTTEATVDGAPAEKVHEGAVAVKVMEEIKEASVEEVVNAVSVTNEVEGVKYVASEATQEVTGGMMVISESVLADYVKAFGTKPNGCVRERLLSYLSRFEEDVVTEALTMAGNKQKGVGYAYGILRNWAAAGVSTYDEMVDYEERYVA